MSKVHNITLSYCNGYLASITYYLDVLRVQVSEDEDEEEDGVPNGGANHAPGDPAEGEPQRRLFYL